MRCFRKPSQCYSHSVQLPTYCSLVLQSTSHSLLYPNGQTSLDLATSYYSISLTHAVNLPHLPSHCFKTCYLCTYCETTGLYRLTLPRQQVFLPPVSQRTDIPPLFRKVHLLLQQARTHPYIMLQQGKMSRN